MNVTMAVCAYSLARWEQMVAAVGSVLDQLRGADDCVLVIDHNDELLGLAADRFRDEPRLRIVPNRGPAGVSGARNAAVGHARGDIVAFLDDDAVAEPGWLDDVRAALAEPAVVAIGTAAVPMWESGSRPSWFPREYDWVVGCTYLGLPTGAAEVRNVNGAAMAFRREIFGAVGGFSAMVGRRGAAYTGCEETELCIRIRQSRPGARIVYLPNVAVRHNVPRERMRIRYFLRRCYGEGLSKARVAQLVGSDDGLASERSYVRSTLPRGVARELRRGLGGRPAGWLAAALIVVGLMVTATGYTLGRLRGYAVTPVPGEVAAVADR